MSVRLGRAEQRAIRAAVLGKTWRDGLRPARVCVQVTFYDGDYPRAWFGHANGRGLTGRRIVHYAGRGWCPDSHVQVKAAGR